MIKRFISFRKIGKNILVVFVGGSGIGNYIMATPFFRELRRRNKDARITLQFLERTGVPDLLKESDLFDEFVCMKKDRRFEYILFGVRNICRFEEVYVDFLSRSRKEVFTELSFLAAPEIISCRLFIEDESELNKIYSRIAVSRESEHETQVYLRMLRPPVRKKNDVRVYFSESDRLKSVNFLKRYSGYRKIGIQTCSNPKQRWKEWPHEKFIDLINMFSDNIVVFLLGSKSDKERIRNICRETPSKNVVDLSGEFNICQTAALISNLDLMITIDSGLMHISYALNIPLIALFGPTEIARTGPAGENSTIIRGKTNCRSCYNLKDGDKNIIDCKKNISCIASITPEEVLKKVGEVIKNES